jgi:hypothetical protein
MVRLQRIGESIHTVVGQRLHNEFAPLVTRQGRECAPVLLPRTSLQRGELRTPSCHRRLTALSQFRAAVRVHELNAWTIRAEPLTERATCPRNTVVPQLTRQDRVGDTPHHRRIETAVLLAWLTGVRLYRSRAHSNAECGTEPAQPADESSAGGHGGECMGWRQKAEYRRSKTLMAQSTKGAGHKSARHKGAQAQRSAGTKERRHKGAQGAKHRGTQKCAGHKTAQGTMRRRHNKVLACAVKLAVSVLRSIVLAMFCVLRILVFAIFCALRS